MVEPGGKPACAPGYTLSQASPVYAGVAPLSMKRQDQEELRKNENQKGSKERFLHVEMFARQPMTENLSGLEAKYAIALIYSSEAGKREATIGFDIGAGTQDLGFRAEAPDLSTSGRRGPSRSAFATRPATLRRPA